MLYVIILFNLIDTDLAAQISKEIYENRKAIENKLTDFVAKYSKDQTSYNIQLGKEEFEKDMSKFRILWTFILVDRFCFAIAEQYEIIAALNDTSKNQFTLQKDMDKMAESLIGSKTDIGNFNLKNRNFI